MKPAESDADILENLERVVASLPTGDRLAAAGKTLVDHLRDNPLSGMYDPSDDVTDEPVSFVTKVMFSKNLYDSNTAHFRFIQYDSRQEFNFLKLENQAMLEECTL